jgi:hypothetical protein
MNSAEILFVEWVDGKPYSRRWLLKAKSKLDVLLPLEKDPIRTET